MGKRPSIINRKLFVDKKIQLPLLLYSLIIATFGTASAAIFSVFFVASPFWSQGGLTSVASLILGAVISYSIMFFVGVYLSNKIAGPLVRLNDHMKATLAGSSPSPLTTRSDDYVSEELIQNYNKIVEKISK